MRWLKKELEDIQFVSRESSLIIKDWNWRTTYPSSFSPLLSLAVLLTTTPAAPDQCIFMWSPLYLLLLSFEPILLIRLLELFLSLSLYLHVLIDRFREWIMYELVRMIQTSLLLVSSSLSFEIFVSYNLIIKY